MSNIPANARQGFDYNLSDGSSGIIDEVDEAVLNAVVRASRLRLND